MTKCARCKKEITVSYIVVGFSGLYGKQCALEVCQGRNQLVRKVEKIQRPLTRAEINADAEEAKSLYGICPF